MKKNDINRQCIMISIILRDLLVSGHYNKAIGFLHCCTGSFLYVCVATLTAFGFDFWSGEIPCLYSLTHCDDIGIGEYKHYSIIAPHLGDISNVWSQFQKGGGPYHLIPLLIQDKMANRNFCDFLVNVHQVNNKNKPPGIEGSFLHFQALSLFICDLMKLNNFTDSDLQSEMTKYIDDPHVGQFSAMRDCSWKYVYFMSKGFVNLSFEDAINMPFPSYESAFSIYTGEDYEDEYYGNSISKQYLQIGQKWVPEY